MLDCWYPYVKSTAVFTCPDLQQPSYGLNWTIPGMSGSFSCSYIPNWYIIERYYSSNGNRNPLTQSCIPTPSTIIAYAEQPGLNQTTFMYTATSVAMNDQWGHVWLSVLAGCNSSSGSGSCQRQSFPHNDGANYLFCDGHVKWQMEGQAGSNTLPCANLWGRVSNTTNSNGGYPDNYTQ
jgi:prepilin-type processing-associated H-X9-DG protein